jgi:hypothetical protein
MDCGFTTTLFWIMVVLSLLQSIQAFRLYRRIHALEDALRYSQRQPYTGW